MNSLMRLSHSPLASRPCVLLTLVAACSADEHQEIPGTQILMDFSRATSFYDAPFPNADRRAGGGSYDLAGFPNPPRNSLLRDVLTLVAEDTLGASVNAAVYFRSSAPLAPDALPTLRESIEPQSPVFLIDIDPDSPAYLRRHPISVAFLPDAGPFGATNLLSILPLQGMPLRAGTRYAAVVLRDLVDADGERLGVSLPMVELKKGVMPKDLPRRAYGLLVDVLVALSEAGIERERVAGLAAFRTSAPYAQMIQVRDYALKGTLPAPNAPFELVEVFDELCTLRSTIDMPVYQDGVPPYDAKGGRWRFNAAGEPILNHAAESNIWVSVPRGEVPAEGLPLVVFIRTGGGGDRPMIERGARADAGEDPIEPGSGPALFFARAGYAGVSVDGPHSGLRNPHNRDEQYLMFKIDNPAALRDNIRQSAVEIILLAHVLEKMTLDVSACPGVTAEDSSAVRFDLEKLTLMGHSMGATIAPLVLALEPRYRATILSGAGASWIENVVHKQSPFVVRELIEWIIGYDVTGRQLHVHDPLLNLLQWGADSADPLSYAAYIVRQPGTAKPRHVLMLQGIVDTYILPPIANALSISLGLDLAGPSLDAAHPQLGEFMPLEDLLDLASLDRVGLPVSENLKGTTAVVVQHAEDGIENGHEVVFQTQPPKQQYQCFLRTLKDGVPLVPDGYDPRCE